MYIRGNELFVEADNFTEFASFDREYFDQKDRVELFKPYAFLCDDLDVLLNFPNLTELIFDKCSIGDLSAIFKLSRIRRLAFYECNFGSAFRIASSLLHLKSLHVGYPTETNDQLLDDIAKLTELQELSIFLADDTTNQRLAELARLERLKRLTISRASKSPLNFISKLQTLEYLDLGELDSSALDETLPGILGLPELKTLSLQGAQLNLDMNLDGLHKLENFSVHPHTDNNLEVLITWESSKSNR